MSRSFLVMFFALLIVAPGCKKKEKAKPGVKGKAKTSDVKKAPEAKVTATPDKAVLQALAAVKKRDPSALYDMLPPSYQKDIQGLISTATTKMDKEIFGMGVDILKTAIAAVEKHSDKIAKKFKGAPFDVKKMLGKVKDVKAILEAAHLLTFDGFQKFQLAAFIKDQGAALMTKAMLMGDEMAKAKKKSSIDEKLAGIKVKPGKVEGDKGTVMITVDGKPMHMKDGKPRGETMVKVEGRWIPEEMAKSWKRDVERAKRGLTRSLQDLAKNKDKIKKMMGMVLASLKEFEKSGDMKNAMKMAKQFSRGM